MEREDEFHDSHHQQISLSEQLRAWRYSARLSIEEVALQIHARPHIILAFEQGDYSVFSARVYAIGYLKRMVDHFSISGGDMLIDTLKVEWEKARGSADGALRELSRSEPKKWYITPGRFFRVSGACIFIFFVWLLVIQVKGFTGAPTLFIEEPLADAVIEASMVRVRGSTEKESQLTVNGREIRMNANGIFDEEIELSYGVNALHFLIKNRFGKSSEQVRYVVVK